MAIRDPSRLIQSESEMAKSRSRFVSGEMTAAEAENFRDRISESEYQALLGMKLSVRKVSAPMTSRQLAALIAECTAPCPPNLNAVSWYAEKNNRLLAAILERMG